MSGPGRTAAAGRAWQGRPRRQQERCERCRQDVKIRTGMAATPAKQQHQEGCISGCGRSDYGISNCSRGDRGRTDTAREDAVEVCASHGRDGRVRSRSRSGRTAPVHAAAAGEAAV